MSSEHLSFPIAKRPSKPPPALTAETRIAVLHGKEQFLLSEHTARLREALEQTHGAVDVLHFDGSGDEIADVLDECRSFGLMSQHKLIVVDEADQFVKDSARAMMERYAAEPSEGATLVLRCQKWNRGKLDKLINEVGAIVKCDAVTADQAAAWAIRRSEKRHGVSLEREAATLLVNRIGSGLARIDSELGKLALSADEGTVTRAIVGEMVGLTRDEEVWGIQSTLLSGSAETAVRHLRDLLDVSRQPTVLVSYACLDLARKLHAVAHALEDGAGEGQAAQAVRLWGESRSRILDRARHMGSATAAELLRDALACDVCQKTGLGKPERILERQAIRFASAAS